MDTIATVAAVTSKIKDFGKKYWKHTAVGASLALAAGAAVVYFRDSTDEDLDLDDMADDTDSTETN